MAEQLTLNHARIQSRKGFPLPAFLLLDKSNRLEYNGAMVENAVETQDFTASSLAEAAGVHFSHVARLCRQGRIPARKFGSAWVIRYEVGRQWLEEREARKAEQAKEP